MNTFAMTAPDEASYPATIRRALIATPPPAQLPETLIEDAMASGRTTARPGWSPRIDGWTPERIRIFLVSLAQCGVVGDAARAAGMSKQSAYAFRNSARGRDFEVGWRAAHLLARRQLGDELLSRALHGCVEVLTRGGEVIGERHRHDNRLAMAVLTRLDTLANSQNQADEAPILAAEEFEAYVAAVCTGPGHAAAFLEERSARPWQDFEEPSIIRRSEEFASGNPVPACPDEDAPMNADEEPDEQTAAIERLSHAVIEVARKQGLEHPGEPSRRDRDPATRRVRGTVPAQEGRDPASLPDEAFASEWNRLVPFMLEVTGLESEIDPSLVLQPVKSSHSMLGEGDRPAQQDGGGAFADAPQPTINQTDLSAEPIPAPEPRQPPAQVQPPEPEVEWVLGDDGLPVKMVNGKLPPHHSRRRHPLG